MKTKTFKALIYTLILTSLFTLSLTACWKSDSSTQNTSTTSQALVDTSENYVATVAGEKITQTQFYFFLTKTKADMENSAQQSGTTNMSIFWDTKINGKDPKEIAKENTLSSLKEYAIELINAKNNKTILTADEKATAKITYDKAISDNGGLQAFKDKIKTQFGLTFEQYNVLYDNFLIIEKFMKTKQAAIQVSDEAATKKYNENKINYDTVTVNHVLFMIIDQNTNQPLPQDKIDLAKKKANDTLDKIRAGENIIDLAKKLSEDPGVTQNGGEYTFKNNGQMVKEFADWAFSNDVGSTGIVKTSYGFHVMKKTKATTVEEGIKSAKLDLQGAILTEELKAWSLDSKYEVKKNDKIYNSLKI